MIRLVDIKIFAWKPSMVILTALVMFLFVIRGCIEEYKPDVDEYVNLIVINGSIIKGDSIQTVTVSRTAAYDEPYETKRISGCVVDVIKENGAVFSFTEQISGIYTAAIPQDEMQFGDRFKVQLQTRDGNLYESDYDQISESSPIDSLYYKNENNQTSSGYSENGLQFYVDLKAPEDATSNYMWQMEETYEIHGYHSVNAIIDGGGPYYVDVPDTLKHLCWATDDVLGIYASSTKNLKVNEKKKIPLHYAYGDDVKLLFGYSLLAKQYALSDAAYVYWYKNQVETRESGGLYQKQPGNPVTNIHCLTNPDEKVLGFFWASSYSEERIFYQDPLNNRAICQLSLLIFNTTTGIWNNPYNPAYLTFSGNDTTLGLYFASTNLCFDCTYLGGTIIKPDFWP